MSRFLLACVICCAFLPASSQPNNKILFDNNWRFYLGGNQHAEIPGFDDSKWRKIDLPHDWSIEDLPGTNSPFNPKAISQVSGGFTTGGTAWYRKTFMVNAADKGKRIIIQFDGVYMNADVWVNGEHVGNHPYGYTSFWCDITSHLHAGQKNVIAVEVKNEGQNSRWYSGSGIYRHVWLQMVQPVHIQPWGQFITTPKANANEAIVHIQTKIMNESAQSESIRLVSKIMANNGQETALIETRQTIDANGSYTAQQTKKITSPVLWSCNVPVMYTLVTELYANDTLVQTHSQQFGVRAISFSVASGFMLNDEPLKLKGGCFHNDNGPLGSKAYDRAEVRKVELLKAAGYNAIRCSHNPPSPAFLDACDSLGMLVIDEAFDCWKYGKNPYDYHLYFNDWWQRDVESMVTRDYNHPSIIMWSIGNEIPESGSAEGVDEAKMLVSYVKSLDDTRPVTSAVNGLGPGKDPYFATLDVAGYNYPVGGDAGVEDMYGKDHERVPGRIMFCTESYPLEAFGSWMSVMDHPYVIGDFVWTAFDYIGEASIGWLGYWQSSSFYPWNLAFCGDIDMCGWKRPQSYYRDALWKPNQLSVFVTPPVPSYPANPELQSWSKWNWYDVVADWNWKGYENKPLQVSVYSSCGEVELFLNGRSLGRKLTGRDTKFMATFKVPYQAGTLTAKGYNNGRQVNESSLYTAGTPVTITATADHTQIKANGQNLSYVTIELKDANGHINPKAENNLQFTIDGPGTIAGVGNANPQSTESFQQPHRKAFKGKCLVIIKSNDKPGIIILHVAGAGLKGADVKITAG
ncbi:MAG TPA: glycoside hydrolase family 2 TIM barrel-domain containing protein [Chitinophagaceae bacterium]|nr:glycoside hydrolase family 2 TIM barrel-domain containing protein [Chitinophagaceae bacterium]